MELPAVAGGFFNVTRPEGNEAMRRKIQGVLRKAGQELMDKGTEREREDLRGVTVNSVQQLYRNVRGMRTCAATNKCEFGYTTPSGEEPTWGPTTFTLYAGYHKRSYKVKEDTARTYHTVRGALVLNEQNNWCELCARAHGKKCEKLLEYRSEEARRKQDLMTRARRENAPTRAQQQASRPEYTISVEKEKQVSEGIVESTVRLKGTGRRKTNDYDLPTVAGTGGSSPCGVRRGGERSRRSERSFEEGAKRHQDANHLPRLPPTPRQLPLYASQVQIFSVQSFEQRHTHRAQGPSPGGGTKGADAGVAAGGQGKQWRRSRAKPNGRGTRGQGRKQRGLAVREGRKGGKRPEQDSRTPRRKNGKRRTTNRNEGIRCEEMIEIKDKDCVIQCEIWRTANGAYEKGRGRARKTKHAKTGGKGTPSRTKPAMDQANCTVRCAIGVSYRKECAIQCERRTLGTKKVAGALVNGTWLVSMLLIRKTRKAKPDAPHRTSNEKSRRRNAHTEVVRRILVYVCCLGGLLLIENGRGNGREKTLAGGEKPEERKSNGNDRGTKKETRAKKAIWQRRRIQQSIRRWNKTRKIKHDGKDWKKYRHKVRASKR
eukprot:5942090-Pleurochrysis_carterae.AAC.1